ncbi:hypothetical protein ACFFF7_08115 [Novosphingobium aquiterrae]|uniref:Uncharacterized protein n=1 Tax=Novosphingobium aquiterrae TaxID=624388 RepID=A0ABV6PHS0_9SPHN
MADTEPANRSISRAGGGYGFRVRTPSLRKDERKESAVGNLAFVARIYDD